MATTLMDDAEIRAARARIAAHNREIPFSNYEDRLHPSDCIRGDFPAGEFTVYMEHDFPAGHGTRDCERCGAVAYVTDGPDRFIRYADALTGNPTVKP